MSRKQGMSSPGLEVRGWSAHEAAVPEAFDAAPGARVPPFRPRSEAEWDWAFRHNPAGSRLCLARRAARVVAGYGALPVRVRAFGEPRVFAWLLEPMLAEDESQATLLAVAEAFNSAHLGPQKDLIHYGWPAEAERPFVRDELGQELVCVSSLLVDELDSTHGAPPTHVEEHQRFGPEVETLYVRCAARWGASAVRDAAFLNWRFVDNPFHHYRILVVPGEAVPRGYAVYRAGSELHPRAAMLLDWLVTPGDEEAGRLLIEAGRARARADRASRLVLSLPEWSPWSIFLQEQGFRHRPTESLLYVQSALPRLDMLWLRDNWWTTLADTLVL